MSDNTHGDYKIELKGAAELEKQVARIDLQLDADSPATLAVTLSLDAKTMGSLSSQDLPKDATVSCGGKGIFKGHFSRLEVTGHSTLRLNFKDGLVIAGKTFESEYLKEQKLEDGVRMIAGIAGLTPRFQGSFSDTLPGTNITGRSYLDHLKELSVRYGFFFQSRPFTNELICVKLGSFKDAVTVDLRKEAKVLDASFHQGLEDFFSSAETRYFNSNKGASERTEVAQSTLYEPLGFLKGHSGFSDKLSQPLAKGRMEVVSTDAGQYQQGRQTLQNALSKRSVQNDGCRIKCTAPLALPGDKIEIKGAAMKLFDGNYYVRGLNVRIDAALPVCEIVGVRA